MYNYQQGKYSLHLDRQVLCTCLTKARSIFKLSHLAEQWEFSVEKGWFLSIPKYPGWLYGMKAVICDVVSCWHCQCCNGWVWRAEVWVWASVPSLLKFKTIAEIKGDYVLDNYGKCLSTSTAWVVREGEGWQDSVCMCSGSSSLSPCCSLQAWHLPQEPQVAPNCASSPSCEGCWVPHTPLAPASPALQPAWSLWHFRGSTVPVHSKLLVVNAQCPAGPAWGIRVSFSTTDGFSSCTKGEKQQVLRIWMPTSAGNHHCLQN